MYGVKYDMGQGVSQDMQCEGEIQSDVRRDVRKINYMLEFNHAACNRYDLSLLLPATALLVVPLPETIGAAATRRRRTSCKACAMASFEEHCSFHAALARLVARVRY